MVEPGREEADWPAVADTPAQPARSPDGEIVSYPMCGRWDCDHDEDWERVSASTPGYGPDFVASVKRERRIVEYHEPRSEWPERLQAERDKRNYGEPLWWGVWS